MTERAPMWTRLADVRDRLIQLRQALDHLGANDLHGLVTEEDLALLADASMVLQQKLDPKQIANERAAILESDPQRKTRG